MEENLEQLLRNDAKVYVAANEDRGVDGAILPRSFTWEDGTIYTIDRVVDVRKAASLKAGGVGLRYTVIINGLVKYLYLEGWENGDRWFIEKKSPY